MEAKTKTAIQAVRTWAQENPHSHFYKDLPTPSPIDTPLADVPESSLHDRITKDTLTVHEDPSVRHIVTSFTPNLDRIYLLPQHLNYQWPIVSAVAAKQSTSQVFMVIFPPLWQLGPLVYYSCRAVGRTVAPMAPRNVELMVQVIREAESNVVFTTIEVAKELQAKLTAEGMSDAIDTWVLVTPLLAPEPTIDELNGTVHLEYHLEPGISVGSRNLAKQTFVPSSEYYFEKADEDVLITSLTTEAFPLLNVRLDGQAYRF